MAYTVHIQKRDCCPIQEECWINAVENQEGVRILKESQIVGRNPNTGEVISIPSSGLDAEIWDEEENSWTPALYWGSDGTVFANASSDFDNPKDPMRALMCLLADTLGAEVTGFEGEVYSNNNLEQKLGWVLWNKTRSILLGLFR